ncbi:hypothetical protein [Alkaliphilus serpentinus]|uniref:Uncharacterized protein n=1 Tax=Alkaliphilus serpentinus TaxID=1482731 RepID=A0A833M9U5_9FIRM|nr:hypothetical protein [Alkaliphilus serpentinus]KAB3529304.1 hypothetical protein F8153_09375 [Alkaliphilus serpentinus]
MSIYEFKYNIDLIRSFRIKLSNEPIPIRAQRVLLKFYAKTLRINLSDKILDDFMSSEITNTLKYKMNKTVYNNSLKFNTKIEVEGVKRRIINIAIRMYMET